MSRKPMNANNRVLAMLAVIILAVGALTWAAVPFYSWFCRTTGYGGTTNTAEAAPGEVLEQTVTVRFDANIDRDLPWTFRPMQRQMTLKIGETGLAFFEAVNNGAEPLTGTASYNVAPDLAGYYFDKIHCFCFDEQTLQPGERVEMPVSFFVDPAIVKDGETKSIRDITLSYTFHRSTPKAQVQASLDGAAPAAVN